MAHSSILKETSQKGKLDYPLKRLILIERWSTFVRFRYYLELLNQNLLLGNFFDLLELF